VGFLAFPQFYRHIWNRDIDPKPKNFTPRGVQSIECCLGFAMDDRKKTLRHHRQRKISKVPTPQTGKLEQQTVRHLSLKWNINLNTETDSFLTAR